MAALNAEVRQRALLAVQTLGREAPVQAAYLFGSHAEGRADQWSDIDLAAFIDGFESWDLDRQTRVILQVQKELGFDIEPHLFSAAALAHVRPGSFASDIVARGVRLL